AQTFLERGKLSGLKPLTGLTDIPLLRCDGSLVAQRRRGRLKSLITGQTLQIEKKGYDRFSVTNRLKVAAAGDGAVFETRHTHSTKPHLLYFYHSAHPATRRKVPQTHSAFPDA